MQLAERLKQLKARDARAQEELRASLFPKVLTTCERMLRDKVRAEEVAEDIWVDFLFQHIDRLADPRAVTSYLRMMTVRRCVRLRERQARHQKLSLGDGSGEDVESCILERIDTEKHQERLEYCMRKLDERARSILRMRYHHDMSLEEIGCVEDVTKQYVGQLIKQYLKRLQRCMKAKA